MEPGLCQAAGTASQEAEAGHCPNCLLASSWYILCAFISHLFLATSLPALSNDWNSRCSKCCNISLVPGPYCLPWNGLASAMLVLAREMGDSEIKAWLLFLQQEVYAIVSFVQTSLFMIPGKLGCLQGERTLQKKHLERTVSDIRSNTAAL